MSQLANDLEKYYNEAYYRRDIKAGIKLIGEITGLISLVTLLSSALFIWLPGIGIPVTMIAATRVLQAAAQGYASLNHQERKEIRAVVRWVNGGIRLID